MPIMAHGSNGPEIERGYGCDDVEAGLALKTHWLKSK
jgi:hypothetical protein